MVKGLWKIHAAAVITVVIMLIVAGPISNSINKHPALRIPALSNLLMVGMALLAKGLDFHIPKGYMLLHLVCADRGCDPDAVTRRSEPI
jgi:predicted tellurium resistance membrane protein TerC